jgi:hypothetical protein
MNFKILSILFIACLMPRIWGAQLNVRPDLRHAFKWDEKPFNEVHFSITASNKLDAVDSTNCIEYRLENLSTNDICYAAEPYIYLTNDLGKAYQLYPHPLPVDTSSGPHLNPQMHAIIINNLKSGEVYSGSVRVEIGENIVPAKYKLVAYQLVLTKEIKTQFHLKSTLDIDLTKKWVSSTRQPTSK